MPSGPGRGVWTALGAGGALAAAGAALLVLIQTPYYITMPGPVTDVQRLIRPYPDPSGALLLTTVYSDPANAAEWLYASVSPTADLVPRRQALPAHLEPEQHERLLAAMMAESKIAAQVVALRAAGYDVQITGQGARVHEVAAGSPAAGTLRPGDIITGVDGQPAPTANDLIALLQRYKPEQQVTLQVRREGAGGGEGGEGGATPLNVPITLGESPDEPGRGRIGIVVLTHLFSYDLPRDFAVDTSGIVGPSAGLVLALGVYDAALAEDVPRGRRIAATGTISTDGRVGPVGGVPHKVAAAERAGAELFLVPQENYDEAAGAARSVRVVAVRTFQEALAAVTAPPRRLETSS
jgi:PDZ domain-containing protein